MKKKTVESKLHQICICYCHVRNIHQRYNNATLLKSYPSLLCESENKIGSALVRVYTLW